MAEIQIENVGAGTLVTINGATIHFESRADAAEFGTKLAMVASLGGDVLDGDPIVRDKGWS